jgi:hypothetical protein
MLTAQLAHLGLHLGVGLVRARVRPVGAIDQPRQAIPGVPVNQVYSVWRQTPNWAAITIFGSPPSTASTAR